jgi:hypothetical protein
MILGKKSNRRRLGFVYFTILARLVDKTGSPSLYTESTRNAVRSLLACGYDEKSKKQKQQPQHHILLVVVVVVITTTAPVFSLL